MGAGLATPAGLCTIWPEIGSIAAPVLEQVSIEERYGAYLERQSADIAAFQRDEVLELPDDLDYLQIPALSNEVRQKLNAARPETIGQASRISGVTPAAVSLLLVHLKKQNKLAAAGNP